MDDKDRVRALLEQEGLAKREWPFEHDAEEDERLAEQADRFVAWVAVIVGLGFLVLMIWGAV